MSRVFNGTSDHLYQASGVATTTPMTIVAWASSDSISDAATRTIASIGDDSVTTSYHSLQRYNANSYAYTRSGATTANSNVAGIPLTAWTFHAAVFASATSRTAYTNAVAGTTNTTSVTPTPLDYTVIGSRAASTLQEYWDGKVAHVAVWTVALTAAEIASLWGGKNPLDVQSANLVAYWPLAGTASPEPDDKGSADMTVSGATGDTTDIPDVWASGSSFPYVSAVSTTIQSDTAGAAVVPVTLPTHQADDILIVAAFNDAGGALSCATSGWAEIAEVDAADNMAWYWKRAASASETSPTVESATTDVFATAFAVRGCVTSGTPYEDATTAGLTTSTTPTGSTITTTAANRLAVTIANINGKSSWSSGFPPSGWMLRQSVDTATGTDARFAVISKTQATAGDVTGPTVGTLATSLGWATLSLAFLPPSTPTSDAIVPPARRFQHMLIR